MSKTRKGMILSLSLAFALASCGGNNADPEPKPTPEKHTISFISNNEIVSSVEAEEGTLVDIPELIDSKNPRQIVKKWSGISDEEFACGKLLVKKTDRVCTATWSERFGTDSTYNIVRKSNNSKIQVDGEKDACFGDAEPVDIETVTSGQTTTKAKAYTLWDSQNLYFFIEVTDDSVVTYNTKGVNYSDSLNLYFDLLHDDSLAQENYTEGWGGKYRGDNGPMCEAWFKIAAGVSFNDTTRYGSGSEFSYGGWLSNAAKEAGCTTVGTTKITSTGYNIEYRVDLINQNIPDYCKPKVDSVMGIGFNLFDKSTNDDSTTKASTLVCVEDCNKEAEKTPKRCSNFKFVDNPNDHTIAIDAMKIRDSYPISNQNIKELPFKDSKTFNVGGYSANFLWDSNKMYCFFKKGALTDSLKIESSLLPGGSIEFYNDKKIILEPSILQENSQITLKATSLYNGEIVIEDLVLTCRKNVNNLSSPRKLFSAKKLLENEEILIDGVKDDGYNSCTPIDIKTKSKDNSSVTGTSYIKWDDEYLYVFTEVIDSSVCQYSSTEGKSNPELKDSVEFWISTCQTLPTFSTVWGTPNRPYDTYCGEGEYRIRACDTGNNITGLHYMFDNKKNVKESYSLKTSNGYTTELKIGLADFADVSNKVNEIIDIAININDGDGTRKGVVSTNTSSHLVYSKPYYMDHLILEK